jgi:signal transduction histidine kinase
LTLVARRSLSAPFDDVALVFGAGGVTLGPSVAYVFSVSVLLIGVLAAGLVAIYLAGRRQIALTQQQRDFVSAVSHELKTPLTSIRMYSEMLREGWAEDGKKRTYYEFIFSESERLSRLIANVLQLAGLARGQPLSLKQMPVSAAYGAVRDVIASQTAGAGFTWREGPAPTGDPLVLVDADALMQVFVNLVDNGIKFSKKTNQTAIETGYDVSPTGREVRFFVRDFGPGIEKDQLKKIFTLFYRPENELTRTTKGTGIGLALVRELADKMGGKVDVESRPGLTEFRLILPAG